MPEIEEPMEASPYLAEIKEKFPEAYDILIEMYNTGRHPSIRTGTLDHMFTWSNTPQGHKYWDDIYWATR